MNKKDNKSIVQTNLSTLLKRFADSDVINKINEEYKGSNSLRMEPKLIIDNKYLKQLEIDDKKLRDIMNIIQEKGIFEPLLIRQIEHKHEIISGRKRLLAAQKLQIGSIPVVVYNFTDEEMLLFLLITMKDQRETNAIELATICKALTTEFKYTHLSLAKVMGISRPQVSNLMRLLNLPKNLLNDIIKGNLSSGHAKAIATLKNEQIEQVSMYIHQHKLSVRATEKYVQKQKQNDDFSVYEDCIAKKTGAQVLINSKKINVTFSSKEELKKYLMSIYKK